MRRIANAPPDYRNTLLFAQPDFKLDTSGLYAKISNVSVQQSNKLINPLVLENKPEYSVRDIHSISSECTAEDDLLDVKPCPSNREKIPVNPYHDIIGKHPVRGIISGASESGKTTLLIWLYNKFWRHYFDEIYVWSPNFELDASWKNLERKPTKYFLKYDQNELEKIIETNRERIKNRGMENSMKILCIFDDQTSEEGIKFNRYLERLATRGRHDNVSEIFATQQYNRVPKTIRINSNQLYLFSTYNKEEMDDMTEELCCALITPAQFRELFYTATQKKNTKGFLHINLQKPLKYIYNFGLKEQVVLKDFDEQRAELEKDNTNPNGSQPYSVGKRKRNITGVVHSSTTQNKRRLASGK